MSSVLRLLGHPAQIDMNRMNVAANVAAFRAPRQPTIAIVGPRPIER
jgi:hypothetical protein